MSASFKHTQGTFQRCPGSGASIGGAFEVVVDAKPDAVAFYEALGFTALQSVREGLLAGEPSPMFLAIETIARAITP